ncbi:hypothetical protein [Bacillus thuringiensis]|nr:hypothetical protein [Bacillus thuringiensis]MED3274814.1 hypothetical protein [Bacillus thuringiensis]
MKKKTPVLLYIGKETYGKRKIEEVFKEVYEHYLGVEVIVTCKPKKRVK